MSGRARRTLERLGRNRKSSGGQEGGRTGPGGQGGDVYLPPAVICDPDDSVIPDPEKGLDGKEGLPGRLGHCKQGRQEASEGTRFPVKHQPQGGDPGQTGKEARLAGALLVGPSSLFCPPILAKFLWASLGTQSFNQGELGLGAGGWTLTHDWGQRARP